MTTDRMEEIRVALPIIRQKWAYVGNLMSVMLTEIDRLREEVVKQMTETHQAQENDNDED